MLQCKLWYLAQLKKRPMLTSVWSTGAMLLAGDIVSQQLIQRRRVEHDWKQTTRMSLMGMFMVAPAFRTVFVALDKVFGPTRTIASTIKKLTVNELLVAPPFLAAFITVNALLQGSSWQTIKHQLRDDLGSVVLANWSLWAPANFINFYLVSLQHRVMFGNVVALVWHSYLAWKTNPSIVPQGKPDGDIYNVKTSQLD